MNAELVKNMTIHPEWRKFAELCVKLNKEEQLRDKTIEENKKNAYLGLM